MEARDIALRNEDYGIGEFRVYEFRIRYIVRMIIECMSL